MKKGKEECYCGSGLQYKKCCGRYSTEFYLSKSGQKHREKKVRGLFDGLKILKPDDYIELSLPSIKDLDFVKMILDYWNSDEFKNNVQAIDGKAIDAEQISEKKQQLLKMTEGMKLIMKLRYFLLHTPFFWILDHFIPKSYYQNPTFIIGYELYSDPVSIEMRCYGWPQDIDEAIWDSKYHEETVETGVVQQYNNEIKPLNSELKNNI